MSTKHRVTLPESFIPMLEAPEGFIARMEGRRIILEPKPTKGKKGAPEPSQPPPRPRFRYTAADRRRTPENAAFYGLSPTRQKVYKAVWGAKRGLLAKDIMQKCKLPHGSVQQTLHWLREHKMIEHEEESA